MYTCRVASIKLCPCQTVKAVRKDAESSRGLCTIASSVFYNNFVYIYTFFYFYLVIRYSLNDFLFV